MPGVNDNLIPAKKGDVRNPKGKPKGTVHWSTIVKQVLEDEAIFEAVLASSSKRPAWVDKLNKKNGLNAIVVAMLARAMSGDNRAADWLRKTGYGDKIDITSGDMPITALVKFVGDEPNDD